LLEEIVQSRHEELRRAYPDLLAVGYGLRTKTARKKRRRVKTDLAIKFMVEKKWAPNSKLHQSPRALPKYLLAYASIGTTRVLCRIPTDVDERRSYLGCGPQTGPQLVAVSSDDSRQPPERGSIACIARVPGDTTNTYAVSAAHLFDLTEQLWPNIPNNVLVTVPGSNAVLAAVSDFAGLLRPAEQGLSFDAALATVSDEATLFGMLGSTLPSTAASSASDIPPSYLISTSHGLLSATKAATWLASDQVLRYSIPGGGVVRVQHSVLVESDAETQPGDSGSPVISADGTKLLGMNIWGGQGISFMIPAYSLLATENYSGLPAGGFLSLVSTPGG